MGSGRTHPEPGRGVVVSVVGPTAAGKSDLAVGLALRLRPAEIVNTDSMQLYRGMDIGTAKLPEDERRGVPHRLLDVWDVTEPADVARYQRLARGLVDGMLAAGTAPVLVGGSGLYVRAVLDELEFPGTDPEIRARLEAELAERGPAALHARLAGCDPAAAEAILPSNGRRIVRALEVVELTGRPFTATLPRHESRYPSVQIGLEVPRPELDERIARRVDLMWEAGLVEEVRELCRHGLAEGRTAPRALGYAQVLRFLAGECDEEAAREETVRATRRFARRQESWFRRDPRVHWLRYDDPDLLERSLELVAAAAPGEAEPGTGGIEESARRSPMDA
ncbi:tRNA (adenosine(37)-N6)-dimethylallyltransferase MiaA [Nocardiopsis sp. CNT-189]|uniref:tRNA (adenosine(37)-N6)-dimethylallyltransferase MiaA n=1 Tax=Nocardiopsis oceanisediminis TaxID=2816862 RepID=UPI003B36C475